MYQRILVPLDGSATAERGLGEAIGLARDEKARLLLLHIVDDYRLLMEMSSAINYDEMVKDLHKYGSEILNKATRAAQEAGVSVETFVRDAQGKKISDIIVEHAREHSCDLIVMGTHGRRGFSHLMLGSDAEKVMRGSTTPVLLVRDARAADGHAN